MQNLLTKEAFLEWCEKQPAHKEYDYWSNECAFGLYLTANNIEFASVGASLWRPVEYETIPLPTGIAVPLSAEPHTYGALTARLRDA